MDDRALFDRLSATDAIYHLGSAAMVPGDTLPEIMGCFPVSFVNLQELVSRVKSIAFGQQSTAFRSVYPNSPFHLCLRRGVVIGDKPASFTAIIAGIHAGANLKNSLHKLLRGVGTKLSPVYLGLFNEVQRMDNRGSPVPLSFLLLFRSQARHNKLGESHTQVNQFTIATYAIDVLKWVDRKTGWKLFACESVQLPVILDNGSLSFMSIQNP
jgi:hypothetical protein